MAIPNRQIGWNTESNLLWQISKQLERLTGVTFTSLSALAPTYKVYTALLTQSGGSVPQSISSGALTQGVTYYIDGPDQDSDFSNVGAPNNNDGTYFVATSSSVPNNYGAASLLYNTGAPVVTVLENTIGNIWFTYTTLGEYLVNSDGLFTYGKTYTYIAQFPADAGVFDGTAASLNRIYLDSNNLQLSTGTSSGIDGILGNTPIEIRVYN